MFVMFAAHLFASFASSPQQAALNALYQPKGHAAIVERINVVGRFATVLTQGGLMEGAAVTEPILVERFSFGWQALDDLYLRYRLDSHGISSRDQAQLLLGMPKPVNSVPPRGVWNDGGPIPDVEAIRRKMRGPLVPYVVVSGAYALGEWYGAGGGQSLFKKSGRVWRLIDQGGGMMGTSEMRWHGVPQSAWCAFGIIDASCPHKN